MVNRRKELIALGMLLLAAGCTDLTEYDSAYEAGLLIISAPDLVVAGSFSPITGGRSTCAMPGMVWVATTEGRILAFDTTTMEQVASWTVGPSSPSAYSDMVFSPMENSVYLLGPYGTIVEVDYPEGTILDDFSICEAPSMLVVDDDGPFMYVTDAATDRILEVRLETNHQSRLCQLSSPLLCLCNSGSRMDTLVLGTMDGAEILSTVGSGIIRHWRFDESVILDVTGIPDDSIHCGVMRSPWGDEAVTLRSFFPDSMGSGSGWVGAVPLAGDIHLISSGTDGVHAYVLSYLGGSMSRLVAYDYQNYRIDRELEIPGYPMDMEMTPGGNLIILTVE